MVVSELKKELSSLVGNPVTLRKGALKANGKIYSGRDDWPQFAGAGAWYSLKPDITPGADIIIEPKPGYCIVIPGLKQYQ